MFFNRTGKFALIILLALIVGKLGWSHRHDDWVQQWFQPQGPVKSVIQFDNGSVRDTAPLNETTATTIAPAKTVKNEAGQLKKCLISGKVVYTDQVCPVGAKVTAVDGGTLAVVPAPTGTVKNAADVQGGQKRLHEMLDIAGGNDQKARLVERVVNQ